MVLVLIFIILQGGSIMSEIFGKKEDKKQKIKERALAYPYGRA